MTSILDELTVGWRPIDIEEYWDMQTTIQPHINETTHEEVIVAITECENCHTPLWLSFRSFEMSIISEHKITNTCFCDECDF